MTEIKLRFWPYYIIQGINSNFDFIDFFHLIWQDIWTFWNFSSKSENDLWHFLVVLSWNVLVGQVICLSLLTKVDSFFTKLIVIFCFLYVEDFFVIELHPVNRRWLMNKEFNQKAEFHENCIRLLTHAQNRIRSIFRMLTNNGKRPGITL